MMLNMLNGARVAPWLVGMAACVLLGSLAPSFAAQALDEESVASPGGAQPAPEADLPSTLELPNVPISQSASTGDGAPSQLRLREGTQLTDRLGRFRQDGDLLTFIDEEGRELGGLPNLGLERILRALKGVDDPESVWWSVSGMVTEFSDRNYLLVTRAVYKAATLPPSPESVE